MTSGVAFRKKALLWWFVAFVDPSTLKKTVLEKKETELPWCRKRKGKNIWQVCLVYNTFFFSVYLGKISKPEKDSPQQQEQQEEQHFPFYDPPASPLVKRGGLHPDFFKGIPRRHLEISHAEKDKKGGERKDVRSRKKCGFEQREGKVHRRKSSFPLVLTSSFCGERNFPGNASQRNLTQNVKKRKKKYFGGTFTVFEWEINPAFGFLGSPSQIKTLILFLSFPLNGLSPKRR